MSKAGLTRKKITVRRGGKSFQRSVMVRAEAIGRRASGKKLNSLNPWEARHTEHVGGQFPKSSGSSGPGSSHSGLAVLAGHLKGRNQWYTGSSTEQAAQFRQATGAAAVRQAYTNTQFQVPKRGLFSFLKAGVTRNVSEGFAQSNRADRQWNQATREDLFATYGRAIHEVHQDPRKWVR